MLGNTITVDLLGTIFKKLPTQIFPPPQIDLDVEELNKYGSGYNKFIPKELMKTHVVYYSSSDRNRCLFNSISLLLYGNEQQAAFLKMMACLKSAAEIEGIVEEISRKYTTPELLTAWASSFTSTLPDVDERPVKDAVRDLVQKEIIDTLADNDSGPIQIIMLSRLVGHKIKIYCIIEELQLTLGSGPSILEIVLVPYSLDEQQQRFNHFVPTKEKTRNFVETCLADTFRRCQGKQDLWVGCDDCSRWMHLHCVSYKPLEAIESEAFICGCMNVAPFQLSSASLKFLRDPTACSAFLDNHKLEIERQADAIAGKSITSWRLNKFSHKKSRPELLAHSCLGAPSEEVGLKILLFLTTELPTKFDKDLLHLVIFPEILIWILTKIDDGNRMKTEFYLKN